MKTEFKQTKSELIAKKFKLDAYDCKEALSELTQKLRETEYLKNRMSSIEGYKEYGKINGNELLRRFYSSLLCSTSEWKTKNQWLNEDNFIIKKNEVALPFWIYDSNTQEMRVYKMYNKSQTEENPQDRFFDDYHKDKDIRDDNYEFNTRER